MAPGSSVIPGKILKYFEPGGNVPDLAVSGKAGLEVLRG